MENSGVSCSNFSHPIVGSFSDRGGRSYIVSHVDPGCQDTLASTALGGVLYTLRNFTACSIDRFKAQLDQYVRTIPDLPSQPGYHNSLDGGDGIQRWTLRDGLAAD